MHYLRVSLCLGNDTRKDRGSAMHQAQEPSKYIWIYGVDMKKCEFRNCKKKVEDYETFCKKHKEFVENVIVALDYLDVHYHTKYF
jgi:hypothetical protein